ncbi:MAG: putative toxin-antitoxin system toxin component, PIN family [Burkholderiales bacterium]|nr:putative toxin-antitoxin system toxin component, PIN family [Burkholderiales bacterium]
MRYHTFVFSLVLDTNVFVGALLRRGGAARCVVRACLSGAYEPLMGAALFAEYEDVLSREALWKNSLVSASEREALLDGFLSVCRWTEVFFAWRPNLPDEADNHLVELAVAGNATAIVTRNIRHLVTGELRFPTLRILTPEQCLEVYPCRP